MSYPSIRLLSQPGDAANSVCFQVAFAAPTPDTPIETADGGCAEARLATGDGQTYSLGNLCAPTAVTWREQRTFDLLIHAYPAPGMYEAVLHWGDVVAAVTAVADAQSSRPQVAETGAAAPAVALFRLSPLPDQPFQRLLKLKVEGLTPGQSLRLDGAAGQVWRLGNDEGELFAAEFVLTYAKPGSYAATLDLLDAEGFWQATLAEMPVEIAEPESPSAGAEPSEEGIAGVTGEEGEAIPAELPAAETLADMPPAELAPTGQPWLPYRNFRPTRVVNTYSQPGGGVVRRSVGTGTWLTARAEAVAGGARWYQTAGGDWFPAAYASFFQPSDLRGVVLDETPPPPPPPHPPGRRGAVTATTLNVRARPGTASNNPPIAALHSGDVVVIYEQQSVDGATWYRIGESRWVHGGYIRLLADSEAPPPPPPPPPGRTGVVTASSLNVRARPGVSASNPPVGVLRAGAQVTIYEEQAVAGEVWYRIGENRWVAGRYVRVATSGAGVSAVREGDVAAAALRLPLAWSVPAALDVYSQPGGGAVVGRLGHNQVVPVLETRLIGNVRWDRIGTNQWVDDRSMGVARVKARPASIGASERWVGVSLAEQTLVAYEGDRPVFAALIASGLPGTPTVQGIFRTWRRLTTGKMSGPGYYIEDVTWTCYFYSGYALHTAYWHDAFGRPRSHGCVNMSPHDAWWVYQWTAAGGPNSPVVYVYWA